MEAPVYPPVQVFRQPIRAPYVLGVDTASIAELLSAPATRSILLARIPFLEHPPEVLKPHLGNFTVSDLSTFMPFIGQKMIADIDASLRQLPRSEWPANE